MSLDTPIAANKPRMCAESAFFLFFLFSSEQWGSPWLRYWTWRSKRGKGASLKNAPPHFAV